MKCATHRGVLTQQLIPHSDADIRINRCSDRAPHTVALYYTCPESLTHCRTPQCSTAARTERYMYTHNSPPVTHGYDVEEYTNRHFGVTERPRPAFEWSADMVFWRVAKKRQKCNPVLLRTSLSRRDKMALITTLMIIQDILYCYITKLCMLYQEMQRGQLKPQAAAFSTVIPYDKKGPRGRPPHRRSDILHCKIYGPHIKQQNERVHQEAANDGPYLLVCLV